MPALCAGMRTESAMSVEDIPEPPLFWTSRFVQSYDLLLWTTDVHEAAGDRFAQRGRPELALLAWERAAAIRSELCLGDHAPVSWPRQEG
jgi:hypothetical protein